MEKTIALIDTRHLNDKVRVLQLMRQTSSIYHERISYIWITLVDGVAEEYDDIESSTPDLARNRLRAQFGDDVYFHNVDDIDARDVEW